MCLAEIFLLIQGPVLKNKPAFRVDCASRRPMGRVGKKVLQSKPALVGERKQPAHQFEKARLLPDIQQFKEFRAGVLPQSRQKPVGLVNESLLIERSGSKMINSAVIFIPPRDGHW